jgi:TonB-dependent receptor
MAKTLSFLMTALLLFFFIQGNLALAADNGTIQGSVRDAQTGDPLPSASVVLVGTSFGAATDVNGTYIIRNVPPGSYTLRVTYIGYKNVEENVEFKEGESVTKDFKLEAVTVQGEVVTVTAQARGQKEAINEQLASKQIVNVVSSARIRELPDANAAEAVGRLPGIAILRSGGEGNQVIVRGLQPKYNEIMIDGVRMASSGAFDRSTDLSMISPYMLEGIEVTKAVTADMDADVIGGTVNFEMREAGAGKTDQEGIGYSLLAQAGYNGLSNAYNKYNNYKYVGSVEGRFFEDRSLGVFAQADLERRNLTSNEFGASYTNLGDETNQYLASSLNLNDVPRDRQRANGTVVLDYKMPEGKISFANFLSSGTTNIVNRGESFLVQTNVHNYSLAYSKSTQNVIMNILHVQQQLPVFIADVRLSHSYSETKNPNDWTIGFQQGSAGLNQFIGATNLYPQEIAQAANNDTNSTYLSSLVTNSSFSRERALTASLDLQTNLNLSDMITAVVKFGGKYRYQTRSYLYDQFTGQGLGLTSASYIDNLIAAHFPASAQYANTTSIPITPFIDRNYDYGKFLNGDYHMVMPLNFGMMSEIARLVSANYNAIFANDAISFSHDNFNSTTNNYTGRENHSAYYVMATVNVGPEITLIPGVRYQGLQTTYTAPRGMQTTSSAVGGGAYNHYDTTMTVNHNYWLPDVVLRYKPFSWFDVRLAYTNTLAYPDYNAIVPRIDVAIGGAVSWNNYKLVPSRSTNYDAYLSFYDNSVGLFTVGGYLKHITDLIYPWNFYVSGAGVLNYYPPSLGATVSNASYQISTYVNDPYKADIWGLEFDWQTHFWYLPKPFDGLILNVNFTHVFSKAQYPYTFVQKIGRQITYVDTSFTDRLLDQPNNIANVTLGYDYSGFSIRLSLLSQSDIWSGTQFYSWLRTSTARYTRWDLSAKQDLPWFGLQLYGDLNNLNGANDVNVIHAPTGVPTSQQSYGLTADLGLRWNF